MRFAIPGLADLLAERAAFLETVEGLSEAQFESGPTLCSEWAPRDVLAHLMGPDLRPVDYVKAVGRIGAGNDRVVEAFRPLSRGELLSRARAWVRQPAPLVQLSAVALLGDNAMHHQDVLRGQGITRDVPHYAKKAVLREGLILGGTRLLTHSVHATDVRFHAGRGQRVSGPAEALGMWLAGRESVTDELIFG